MTSSDQAMASSTDGRLSNAERLLLTVEADWLRCPRVICVLGRDAVDGREYFVDALNTERLLADSLAVDNLVWRTGVPWTTFLGDGVVGRDEAETRSPSAADLVV